MKIKQPEKMVMRVFTLLPRFILIRHLTHLHAEPVCRQTGFISASTKLNKRRF